MIAVDYSAVSQLSSCPARWAYEHKLGLKAPIGSAVYLGSAFHAACAGYYNKKIAGEQLTLAQYQDIFINIWTSGEAARDRSGNIRNITWQDPEPIVFAQGLSLCESYYPYAKQVEPMFVEQRLERQLSDDITVYGTVDLIDAKGNLIDIKTSSRALSQSDLEASLQPTFYAYLVGGPTSSFIYHDVVKTKVATFQSYQVQRTQLDINWLRDAIPMFVELMQRGPWCPNRTSLCKWCGYQSICLQGQELRALEEYRCLVNTGNSLTLP